MGKEINLKTEFDFDAAHRLVGYRGKCNNLHGHMWWVEIEIEGNKDEIDDVGILFDFSNVKKIKDAFDHRTILKDCEENKKIIEILTDNCGEHSVWLMDKNPTAENLCYEIIQLLKEKDDRFSYNVRVWESPKSYAEVTR